MRPGGSEIYIPDKFERAAKEPPLSITTRIRLHLLGGPLGLTTVIRKRTRIQRTARQEPSTELEPRKSMRNWHQTRVTPAEWFPEAGLKVHNRKRLKNRVSLAKITHECYALHCLTTRHPIWLSCRTKHATLKFLPQ